MSIEANNPGEGQAVEGAAATATDAGAGAATETGAAIGAGEGGAATGDAGSATGHVRPEGLPDDLWDDATGVKTGDLWAQFRDMQAKEAERTADVPGAEDAYDLALPADVTVPEGLEVEFAKDDPFWSEIQGVAKEAGVNRAAFGKFVGAFAKYQIAAQQQQVEAYVAEKTALGANADQRIDAAGKWLKANLPGAQADALGGALISKAGVEGLEALIRLKSGPLATTGAGATATNQFEGLHGAARLEAIRAHQAAG